MRYKLSAPATLHTTVQLPASKSISNRALILHALAQGHITPTNLSDCDDTCVMIKALDGNPEHIDILAAGTAMRFLTAYLSVTPGTRIITGTERMQQRPIRILVDALRELGAQIEYAGNEGFSLTYHRYNIDRRRNQPCRKCKFTIHIRFTDDRPYPEKRIKAEPDRRNHFTSLYQSDSAIDERIRCRRCMEFRPASGSA